MKITYTKPNKISILRELDSLGVPVDVRNDPISPDHFPSIVKDEYIGVWDKFITTQAAKDLYALGTMPLHGNFNVVVGFISYIKNITTSALHGRYNLAKVSRSNLTSSLHDIKNALPQLLRLRRIDKKTFSLDEIDIQIADDFNPFVSAYTSVEATVFLTYSPRRKRVSLKTVGGSQMVPNSLDTLFYTLRDYMFKGSKLPRQMQGTKKINGTGKIKYKYTDLHTVKRIRSAMWHLFDAVGNLTVYSHRSGENTFTLKFTLDVPTIYFGGEKRKSELESELILNLESILKLR